MKLTHQETVAYARRFAKIQDDRGVAERYPRITERITAEQASITFMGTASEAHAAPSDADLFPVESSAPTRVEALAALVDRVEKLRWTARDKTIPFSKCLFIAGVQDVCEQNNISWTIEYDSSATDGKCLVLASFNEKRYWGTDLEDAFRAMSTDLVVELAIKP